MLYVGLFFLLLTFLFLLSQVLTKQISLLFYKLTKSQKWTVTLLALLFLPGTLIHELAHFLTAVILQVYAADLELMPKVMGNTVKLGSVAIGKTDPIRRMLIGIAPFLLGTGIVLGTLYFVTSQEAALLSPLGFLAGYIIFEVSNTMFSSKKDLEGVMELFVTLFIIGLISFFVGLQLHVDIPSLFPPQFFSLFETGSLFLLLPLLIDILIITVVQVFHYLLKK